MSVIVTKGENKGGTFRMKRRSFRDFYYDHSDILLAIIILLIAGIVIMWRINIIVEYPNTLQDISGVTQTTEEQNNADTAKASEDDKKSDQAAPVAAWSDDKLAEEIKVKVKGKKAVTRINCLIDAGLFTSTEDYENACNSAEVNYVNIKKGTYTFKAGSTKEDIAKKVTKK